MDPKKAIALDLQLERKRRQKLEQLLSEERK